VFLLYIDSSGDAKLGGDRALFATLGVCVHEGTWFAIEKRVTGLKNKYACPGQPLFELHAKDFCTNINEQDEIPDFLQLDRAARRQAVLELRQQKLKSLTGRAREKKQKKFRDTAAFVHLSRLERNRLFIDTLDLIGSHDGIRLFAEVLDKQHLFAMTGQTDGMQNNFTQVVSRFDMFLTRYQRTGNSQSPENGMLVVDKEPTHENNCIKLLSHFRQQGHPWGMVRHVIEVPFFVDSAFASAIQLADVAAYALRRYVEKNNRNGTHEEENLYRIFHKFDRAGPRLHGVRHFCKPNTCDCMICSYRAKNQPDADNLTNLEPPSATDADESDSSPQ